MLRIVALLVCVAVSNSLVIDADRVQKKLGNRWADGADQTNFAKTKTVVLSDTEDSLANLAKDFSGGMTYPALTDLMELDSSALLDVNKPKEKKIKVTFVAKKEEVIKAGDGKTYPKTGDAVWVRMKAVATVKHYHETKFDNFMEYVYPAPVMPGMGGQKSPLPTDVTFLPQMSAGEIARFTMKPNGTVEELKELSDQGGDAIKDGITFEVELRSVNPSTEQEPEEHRQELKEADVMRTVLKKQKLGIATMSRTSIKAGDGVTHVQKGDNVTVRMFGVAKRTTKGKPVKYSQMMTFEYPMLTESYSMMGFKIKDSWDEKTLPDMTQGETLKIQFEPMQFCVGGWVRACGQRQHFDEFNIELVKVN